MKKLLLIATLTLGACTSGPNASVGVGINSSGNVSTGARVSGGVGAFTVGVGL